eukprot:scaffold295_cov257-Pinguiococcus_pyrenoidosus.AAC.18
MQVSSWRRLTWAMPWLCREDPEQSPSAAAIVSLAKEHGIYLIGGSVPERCDDTGLRQHRLVLSSRRSPPDPSTTPVLAGKIYNTCIVVSPEGDIVGKHRKVGGRRKLRAPCGFISA